MSWPPPIFQKGPQILMAHPDQGFATLADLNGHPILTSQDARSGCWEWLKAAYGYSDDDLDLSKADTLQFVNRKVGIDLKPKRARAARRAWRLDKLGEIP